MRRAPPPVELADLLAALRDVLRRAELYTHHQVGREPLSVRERMSRILQLMDGVRFTSFVELFSVEDGRLGVVVTLLAILELMRESLLELVQTEPFAPIHVRLRTA
jgi:segregation and condensation protein A